MESNILEEEEKKKKGLEKIENLRLKMREQLRNEAKVNLEIIRANLQYFKHFWPGNVDDNLNRIRAKAMIESFEWMLQREAQLFKQSLYGCESVYSETPLPTKFISDDALLTRFEEIYNKRKKVYEAYKIISEKHATEIEPCKKNIK